MQKLGVGHGNLGPVYLKKVEEVGAVIKSAHEDCLIRKDYHHKCKTDVSENTPSTDILIIPLLHFLIYIYKYIYIYNSDFKIKHKCLGQQIFPSINSRKNVRNLFSSM